MPKEEFILVEVCYGDEKFDVTVVHGGTEVITIFESIIIRIAGHCRICTVFAALIHQRRLGISYIACE
jgi:hypothetical protein